MKQKDKPINTTSKTKTPDLLIPFCPIMPTLDSFLTRYAEALGKEVVLNFK
jgi:hypothetical protein